ncbi:MAG: hypothetical protein N3D10_01405 [Candidatus Micrarchaeota archaeon]|nr:hypothetical protein [Candidatus Micrarchaeota archaeon]
MDRNKISALEFKNKESLQLEVYLNNKNKIFSKFLIEQKKIGSVYFINQNFLELDTKFFDNFLNRLLEIAQYLSNENFTSFKVYFYTENKKFFQKSDIKKAEFKAEFYNKNMAEAVLTIYSYLLRAENRIMLGLDGTANSEIINQLTKEY